MESTHVLIHVFSGTGNTLSAAREIQNHIQARGGEAVLHPIEQGTPDRFDEAELHIFLFPVYATAVPPIMLGYIRRLPRGQGRAAAVVATNGRISTRFRDGYQGWALHQARLQLRLHGFMPFFSETLDYPHNVTCLIPPGGKKRNETIIRSVQKRIPEISTMILKGKTHHRGFLWIHLLWSLPFGLLFSLIGHRMFGKIFVADPACNGCGRCARRCPAGTIRMIRGRPSWNWRCQGCLRCMNECPQRAIQTSAFRSAAFIALTVFNPLAASAALLLPQPAGAWVAAYLISIVALDFLLALLTRLTVRSPLLSHILTWGHTSLYGRYLVKRDIEGRSS